MLPATRGIAILPLTLHPNQERVRPQLERLATLAREGDRRAREELTAMGVAWKDAAPNMKLALVRAPAPAPEGVAAPRHVTLTRGARSWIPSAPTPLEWKVLRGLVLACLCGLTVRYVASCVSFALTALHH